MLSGVIFPILSYPILSRLSCLSCLSYPIPSHSFCLKDKIAGHNPDMWFRVPLLAVTFRETEAVGVNVQGQLPIPQLASPT